MCDPKIIIMVAKIVEKFYVKKKSKFMRSFDERLAVVNEELCKKFDNKKSEELINQMKAEFVFLRESLLSRSYSNIIVQMKSDNKNM